jgi:hypothetical protein
MSILNRHSLSFCQMSLEQLPAAELFAKAVCRLPLTAVRRHLFAKPPLPNIEAEIVAFDRPRPPA